MSSPQSPASRAGTTRGSVKIDSEHLQQFTVDLHELMQRTLADPDAPSPIPLVAQYRTLTRLDPTDGTVTIRRRTIDRLTEPLKEYLAELQAGSRHARLAYLVGQDFAALAAAVEGRA